MSCPRVPPAKRLQTRLAPADDASGCIIWTGPVGYNGYGYISLGGRAGKVVRVHRLAYEMARGQIPAGMQIDHLCRNRRCCNPAHLEAVTSAENTRRGNSPSAISARTGLCAKGHVMDEANTVIVGSKRSRTCRLCHSASRKNWRARVRAVKRDEHTPPIAAATGEAP